MGTIRDFTPIVGMLMLTGSAILDAVVTAVFPGVERWLGARVGVAAAIRRVDVTPVEVEVEVIGVVADRDAGASAMVAFPVLARGAVVDDATNGPDRWVTDGPDRRLVDTPSAWDVADPLAPLGPVQPAVTTASATTTANARDRRSVAHGSRILGRTDRARSGSEPSRPGG